MNIGQCKTCKHWGEHDDYEPGFRCCERIGRQTRSYVEYRDITKAFTRDNDDHTSWLVCAPDFGCVLHEPREPEVGKSPDSV